MKKFIFIPSVLLLLASCGQVQFTVDEDVYKFRDPASLRPSSAGVTPEASLDGFSQNQENGSRSTFYDPQTDLSQNPAVFAGNRNCKCNNFGNSWSSSSFGYNPYGYNPYGCYGYGSMGMNSWGMNSWSMNSWGYQHWGLNSWGYNPYFNSFYNPYGPWGSHGGMGWNPYGYNGWTNSGLFNIPGYVSNGPGASGSFQGSGHHGPRPNLSSSYNPNNLNVGSGNASPIGSNGQPINNSTVVNSNRGIDRQTLVSENASRGNTGDRQALSSNSSPWNPRVDGAQSISGRGINQPSSGRVNVPSGSLNTSRPSVVSNSGNNRPAPSATSSSPSSRSTYPSTSSSSPSRSNYPSYSGGSSRSSGGTFGGSSSGARSSGSSGGGSFGGGSSSSGSSGGGRSSGSSGGSSSGGGRRP